MKITKEQAERILAEKVEEIGGILLKVNYDSRQKLYIPVSMRKDESYLWPGKDIPALKEDGTFTYDVMMITA